jgi:hypothetical protein
MSGVIELGLGVGAYYVASKYIKPITVKTQLPKEKEVNATPEFGNYNFTRKQKELLQDQQVREEIRQNRKIGGDPSYVNVLKAAVIERGEDPVIDVNKGTGNTVIDTALLNGQLRKLKFRAPTTVKVRGMFQERPENSKRIGNSLVFADRGHLVFPLRENETGEGKE